jgi:diacylglycerol kinase (ATP)
VRALLVVNPYSRRGREQAGAVAGELKRRGIEVVEAPAGSGRVDALVVAGGDGTFIRQIDAAMQRGIPMGLIPLGTFNDLARTLEIPQDVGEACDAIASGRTRAIDVARVNGSFYVNEASIGVSSRITRLQRTADKQRFGPMAVLWSALQAFRYARPLTAEISYDGICERVKAIQITVANSDRFGGFITVDDASIEDGLLDCYVVDGNGLLPVVPLLLAVLRRRRPQAGRLRALRSTAFKIVTRHPHHVAADGEAAGTTPAAFDVLPKALKIFVPTP